MKKLRLSARPYNRILSYRERSLTLETSVDLKVEHLAEVIHYKSLDNENWAG